MLGPGDPMWTRQTLLVLRPRHWPKKGEAILHELRNTPTEIQHGPKTRWHLYAQKEKPYSTVSHVSTPTPVTFFYFCNHWCWHHIIPYIWWNQSTNHWSPQVPSLDCFSWKKTLKGTTLWDPRFFLHKTAGILEGSNTKRWSCGLTLGELLTVAFSVCVNCQALKWPHGKLFGRESSSNQKEKDSVGWHLFVVGTHTSSTAQGGGGSFKNRKSIGEIGRCESPMAEQKHWWIELSNCVTD